MMESFLKTYCKMRKMTLESMASCQPYACSKDKQIDLFFRETRLMVCDLMTIKSK